MKVSRTRLELLAIVGEKTYAPTLRLAALGGLVLPQCIVPNRAMRLMCTKEWAVAGKNGNEQVMAIIKPELPTMPYNKKAIPVSGNKDDYTITWSKNPPLYIPVRSLHIELHMDGDETSLPLRPKDCADPHSDDQFVKYVFDKVEPLVLQSIHGYGHRDAA